MTQEDGADSTGAPPVDDETGQVVGRDGRDGLSVDDVPLERAASWLRLTSLRLSGDLDDVTLTSSTDHVMALLTAQFHTGRALALLEGWCGAVPDAALLDSALNDGFGAHLTASDRLDQVEAELTRLPASTAPRDLASVWAEMAGARLALTSPDVASKT